MLYYRLNSITFVVTMMRTNKSMPTHIDNKENDNEKEIDAAIIQANRWHDMTTVSCIKSKKKSGPPTKSTTINVQQNDTAISKHTHTHLTRISKVSYQSEK